MIVSISFGLCVFVCLVSETQKVTILWDTNIQINHVIEHRRSDSRRRGQQDGALDGHRNAGRHNSGKEGAGEDKQIPGSGTRTEEALESRN